MLNDKKQYYLSEETRAFASRAIAGEFGIEMRSRFCAIIDDTEFSSKSPCERYKIAVNAVVNQDVIRIIEGEMLAGSASFDKTRMAVIPVALSNGDPKERIFRGHDHLTPNFEKVLKKGLCGIETEIMLSMEKHRDDPRKVEYLDTMLQVLGSFRRWHGKYLSALDDRIAESSGAVKERYVAVRKNLERVPLEAASDFREAIQSLWFTFAFLRALGNWSAVGRFDYLLGEYLENDLAQGKITVDEAREYIAHFWIKGCEWVALESTPGNRAGSGDGQNYQNVVLSGCDENGKDITNTVTYLVLDVIEELRIADYPTSVRISSASDPKLIRRLAEVMKLGGGILAVYNDDIVIPSLVKFGYELSEARLYANDGCWEVQVPGKTNFAYWAWDVLGILHSKTLNLLDGKPSALPFQSFEELYSTYLEHIDELYAKYNAAIRNRGENGINPMMSMLVEDCISTATDYELGGAHYKVRAPHAGGLPDAANALYAIKHVVYDKKMMSLCEFIDIVKSDFEGKEDLAAYLRTHLSYYGNGDGEGDMMMRRLFGDFTALIGKTKSKNGYIFPAGVSTFGRQITDEFLKFRTANPTGHKNGTFLANNIDPTPGTDISGSTAVLRSYGALNLVDLPGGTALDIKLSPATVRGEEGTEGLTDLLYAFCALGCYFMQPDVVDTEYLKKAQSDPETYGNITVRVSGWSSRFRTLSKEWQQMVIERTEMGY